MEFTINQLAKMSGVTTRTLRYYNQIGLLVPNRRPNNQYRVYGQKEVDLLQQILFFREMGVELKDIEKILNNPSFNREDALNEHLQDLLQKREQIDKLIKNVEKTIRTLKGDATMRAEEKFEGFKKSLIDQNEQKYGKEIRERYGDDAIHASYTKVKGMTQEKWLRSEQLRQEYEDLLEKAFMEKDAGGEDAMRACDLHRQWLCMFWKDGTYSKEAHAALGEGYVSDERFKAYYDRIAPGCAEFFRDCLKNYCK